MRALAVYCVEAAVKVCDVCGVFLWTPNAPCA